MLMWAGIFMAPRACAHRHAESTRFPSRSLGGRAIHSRNDTLCSAHERFTRDFSQRNGPPRKFTAVTSRWHLPQKYSPKKSPP